MSVENNGWTWSSDHEDWYRAELLADGNWNYIFSKDTTTYAQSTPRNLGRDVEEDEDEEDENCEETEAHPLEPFGSRHAPYGYGPSTSAAVEDVDARMAALSIGQPQNTGYYRYGGYPASSGSSAQVYNHYQPSSSSTVPATHTYASAQYPYGVPTGYSTGASSNQKGKQVAQNYAGQPAYQQYPPSPAGTAATQEETAAEPSEADDEVETVGGPQGLIRGTAGNVEKLDPSFQRVKDHWTFFVPGRVFSTLWWESSGNQREGPSLVQYGEQAFAKVYRFIVVRAKPREYYSKCIQISTHGGRATTKKGLNQAEHTIVYTGSEIPQKIKGETNLRKDAINIIPINPKEKLDALSRVNLAKTYPVEHNVKVKEVGKVNAAHLKKLVGYWKNLTIN
ncbi:hypothetical protein MMC14_005372 [Varicellaria rhodocarpa]|nr:hypothetical protein [Varicellaria rhodocarpa]